MSASQPASIKLLVDQDAGQFFVENQLAAGGLGALSDLLRRLLAGVELTLQGLQALLEFLFDAVQCGRLFFGQALVGAGFGVHLPGEDGVLFLFAGDQFGELLIAFEGGVLLPTSARSWSISLCSWRTARLGSAGGRKGPGRKPAPALPNDW